MGNESFFDKINLTIVGGQPLIKGCRRKAGQPVQVPVGLSKLLYHASRSSTFRQLLLHDTDQAILESGVTLRDSERTMLRITSPETLGVMIDNLVTENPRRRKFMGLVAAAAASIAAGTASLGCHKTDPTDHAETYSDSDVETDTESETETSSDTETGSDTETWETDTFTETGTNPDTETWETDTFTETGTNPDTGIDDTDPEDAGADGSI